MKGLRFTFPEVDGFGIVLRSFGAVTVNGLAFSTMADSTAGGRQVEGFHGISIEYMRSKKFMHADGGYDRVVWMPHETRERLKEFIPEEVYTAIATEKDVADVAELKTFLQEHHHPVVQRWVAVPEPETGPVHQMTVISGEDIPLTSGGFRIILKNARITAESVIIQPIRPSRQHGGGHSAEKKY